MKGFCALCMAWLVACSSVFCSLYFREGLETCNLCWLQRVCMYPLFIILGMAVYNNCYTIVPYVLPQVGLGCLAAIYQVIVQMNLSFDVLALCQTGPSCMDNMNIGMEFITFPMLSVCAFAMIMVCLCYGWRQSRQDPQLVYIRIK